ncbi:MAG: phosphoglycerate kinase [Thermonemataceae bacterium]
MLTLDQYNFKGKKALVRVDFNVPLNEHFEITDDTRIQATIPTIEKIRNDGGAVILMSHLGRPKEGYEEKFSLKHLVPKLSAVVNTTAQFATDCIGEAAATKAAALQSGEILLLENLRFHEAETKGEEAFSKQLAALADVYVNDAFGTAHRKHASTAVVAAYFTDKIAGQVMQAELENAQKVLEKAERPFTAIMGGAKISDKIQIIEKLLDKVDNLIIGGGMTYTFIKASGGEVGNSLVEEEKLTLATTLLEKAIEKKVNLILPQDSIVADRFAQEAHTKVANNRQIPPGWMGLDIGPKAIETFSAVIAKSATILWNGPMGVFEMEKFAQGTKAVAEAVV